MSVSELVTCATAVANEFALLLSNERTKWEFTHTSEREKKVFFDTEAVQVAPQRVLPFSNSFHSKKIRSYDISPYVKISTTS